MLLYNELQSRDLFSAGPTGAQPHGTGEITETALAAAQDALGYTELRADADGIITARSAEVGQVAQAAQMVFRLARDGARLEQLLVGHIIATLDDLKNELGAPAAE